MARPTNLCAPRYLAGLEGFVAVSDGVPLLVHVGPTAFDKGQPGFAAFARGAIRLSAAAAHVAKLEENCRTRLAGRRAEAPSVLVST